MTATTPAEMTPFWPALSRLSDFWLAMLASCTSRRLASYTPLMCSSALKMRTVS